MRYFEDYQLGVRERSAARTLTETHVIQFCMLTGDWYPLHADKEWAEKEGPFGRRIAHGFLVLSFASGLMPLQEMAIVAFYGMDTVRFVAPTFIDDTLHVETEVVALDDRGAKGGVVTQRAQIVDHRGELKADYLSKILLRKRSGATA
jgi:3-hydroxybutyryl-CoA dehydratase